MESNRVCLPYMALERVKTTVYLDGDVYRRLKTLGRSRGVAPAELVREATSQFVTTHAPRKLPKSIGKGASKHGNLSERVDELLEDFGR